MKVALIGFGYWGKIIYKNLKSTKGITEIKICDPLLSNQNIEEVDVKIDSKYYDYDVDYVFIVTPAQSHKEIVEYFLNTDTHVFCEKPLCLNSKDVNYLYNLAKNKNKKLFVDWIFTFNNHINLIKQYYKQGEFGKIKNIEMNRLNFGPVRNDVNACWDLASHDVSIIQYIFEDEFPEKIKWINYKRDNLGNQDDTCVGVLKYNSFDCIINTSWRFGDKFRKCIFEFEKGFLIWDDKKGELLFNGKELKSNQITSPLQNSLIEFFNYCNTGYMVSYDQKKLTENITTICSHEN
jgi:UDP-N-acetylglucosamine 3-dehydrogenase